MPRSGAKSLGRAQALALAMLAVGSLISAPSRAFPSSRLVYTREKGAEHCPDGVAVRLSVAARLGYDPFVASADRTIVARIVREATRLTAEVELVDDSGTSYGRRQLSAPADRCEELVLAMALSISLAIDPERAQSSPLPPTAKTDESSPSEKAEPEQPERVVAGVIAPEPAADSNVERVRSRKAKSVVYTGAGAHAAFGTAPAATGGVSAFVGVQSGTLSLGLEGRLDAPGVSEIETGERISSWLLATSFLPCFHESGLFGCASATAGVITATAQDVTAPKRDRGLYAAVGARVGAELPLSRELTLRLHLDLWATLTPIELELDDRSVWQAPVFAGALGLGLMARF